jgi:CRP/FNR family transcriptional regulator, cyclic AMP receptor protein
MVEYSPELYSRCFSFLEKPEAHALLGVMESLELKAGATLFKANDPADCLFVLVSGKIAVQKQTGFGDRRQVVALLDPGAPLGEIGVLEDQARGATLVAVTDSQLLSLSHREFMEIVTSTPTLAVKILSWLMKRLALRLQKSSERLAHVL